MTNTTLMTPHPQLYSVFRACCSPGGHIYDVDLKASPRVADNERPISLFKKIDAAMCNAEGVTVVVGNHFYKFESTMVMVAGRALPEQHRVSLELFGCDH